MPADKSPIDVARRMFDEVKKHFAPGDMAQGFVLDASNKIVAAIAIDSGFFEGIASRLRLQALLKARIADLGGESYIQISDSWRLKNQNIQKIRDDPPPEHASVTWMAKNGYGDLEDELLGIVQTKLGVWMIAQPYEMLGGRAQWRELEICPVKMESYTEIIPQFREQGRA